jgi:hypothetical protein
MAIIEPFLKTPTLRGLLSLFLRTIRVDDIQDSADQLIKGLSKELQTTQCTTRRAILSYPIFSSYDHAATIPMHSLLPFRPFAQVMIHNVLRRWRVNLQKYLYLPQCSYKSIGKISEDNLLAAAGIILPSDHKYHTSTAVLETFYMKTGRMVDGPCEVRSAWKYSQLKPRIYYAIGASSYYAARYTWRIFDSLQRAFKSSDPFHRFTFHRFPCIDFTREVFLIYDYTSFTSNMADFPRFCSELVEFLRGYKVKVYDTCKGLIDEDLGEILEQYNRVCNVMGEFDVSRVLSLPDGSTRIVLHHHVAGMLGVYGNITGSTALHGIVGILIAGGEDRINTIGDDAAGIFDTSTMSVEEIKSAIRTLGDIEEDKFEIWDEDQSYTGDGIGWKFVKRPLNVECDEVISGWMPDFPIYPVLLAEEDESHDSIHQSFSERRRSAIRQSIRLMESMLRHTTVVEDTDIQIALEFLTWLFNRLQIPLHGSLPVGPHRGTVATDLSHFSDEFLATPVLTEDSFRLGWWQTLCKNVHTETGYIRLPEEAVDGGLPSQMIQGDIFKGGSRKVYGLLEKLGVLDKKALFETRLVTEANMDRYGDFISGRRLPCYEYTVIESHPQWVSYYDAVCQGLRV